VITIRGRIRLEDAEREPVPAPPSRLARMVALAHLIERLTENGDLRDYADAARRLGVSRERVSQVARLRFLAPAIQERILCGNEPISERQLRPVAKCLHWEEQGKLVETLNQGSIVITPRG
jgi:hypothetical protein